MNTVPWKFTINVKIIYHQKTHLGFLDLFVDTIDDWFVQHIASTPNSLTFVTCKSF